MLNGANCIACTSLYIIEKFMFCVPLPFLLHRGPGVTKLIIFFLFANSACVLTEIKSSEMILIIKNTTFTPIYCI
jgi:hypothetical protein